MKDIVAFREAYRARAVAHGYLGWLHFGFVVMASSTVMILSLRGAAPLSRRALLTIPIAFFGANLVEYFGHRFPMHRRTKLLARVYERHTREHHRFFTAEAMSADSPRDFKVVLFPPVLLAFFLGGIGIPIALLLQVTFGGSVARLFLATAAGYYLLYECLHLAYHLPKGAWLSRIVGPLREHHRLHHHPPFMRSYHLNITFPIGDLLFGTMLPEAERKRAP